MHNPLQTNENSGASMQGGRRQQRQDWQSWDQQHITAAGQQHPLLTHPGPKFGPVFLGQQQLHPIKEAEKQPVWKTEPKKFTTVKELFQAVIYPLKTSINKFICIYKDASLKLFQNNWQIINFSLSRSFQKEKCH